MRSCDRCGGELPDGSNYCPYCGAQLFQRIPIPPKLRFLVMDRDEFSCQYCGATRQDGAKLHVDHILPVAWGGTNDFDNLTTACETCNLGKGKLLPGSNPYVQLRKQREEELRLQEEQFQKELRLEEQRQAELKALALQERQQRKARREALEKAKRELESEVGLHVEAARLCKRATAGLRAGWTAIPETENPAVQVLNDNAEFTQERFDHAKWQMKFALQKYPASVLRQAEYIVAVLSRNHALIAQENLKKYKGVRLSSAKRELVQSLEGDAKRLLTAYPDWYKNKQWMSSSITVQERINGKLRYRNVAVEDRLRELEKPAKQIHLERTGDALWEVVGWHKEHDRTVIDVVETAFFNVQVYERELLASPFKGLQKGVRARK